MRSAGIWRTPPARAAGGATWRHAARADPPPTALAGGVRYNDSMSTTPIAPADMPFEAAAFAARARTRRKATRPTSAVFRVCLVARHFADDPHLRRCALHVEAPTHCDDIIRFGSRGVAALTRHACRTTGTIRQDARGSRWPVKAEARGHLRQSGDGKAPVRRAPNRHQTRFYLDAIAPNMPANLQPAHGSWSSVGRTQSSLTS